MSGPYLIPAFVFSATAGLFLFFRCEKTLLDSLSLNPLPPGDPWGLDLFLQKSEPSFPVTLYLIKIPFPLSFCLGGRSSSRIVFSEKLLETLSEEEKKLMIRWYVRAGERGSVFFLTVLSVILRRLGGFFSFISLPDRLFGKKRKMNIVFRWILYGLRRLLRGMFFRMDKAAVTGQNPRKLALILWKMQSLYETDTCPLPFFFAPLFFADPLAAPNGPAVPLQPDKQQRVRLLTGGAYPP